MDTLQLLDEKEVATLLRRSVQTLRNDRNLSRGLPFVKLGRSVRYRFDDVQKYLADHRIEPTG